MATANANNNTPSVRVRAPKLEHLNKVETITSFHNWKETMIYSLYLDDAFKPYLKENVTWGLKTSTALYRGFVDDVGENALTREDKCAILDLMLGQIANYATVISRNQITKNSRSLNEIWN